MKGLRNVEVEEVIDLSYAKFSSSRIKSLSNLKLSHHIYRPADKLVELFDNLFLILGVD
jgi:hypothetical protein